MSTAPTKLWNVQFIKFIIGWELSLIATTLIRFALPLSILLETGDSQLMGAVMAFSSVPLILLTPIGGAIADRFNKRKVLVSFNLLTAVFTAGFVLVSGYIQLVSGALVLMMLLFALDSMLSPAYESSAPLLVPTEELIKANSLTFMFSLASGVLAPVLGGFIIYHRGLNAVLVVSVSLYTLAAVVKMLTRIPHTPSEASGKIVADLLRDLKQAVVYASRDNLLIKKILTLMFLYSVLLAPAATVGLSVLFTQHLGVGEELVGMGQGVAMFGGVVSSMLLIKLGNRVGAQSIRLLFVISALMFVPMGLVLLIDTSVNIQLAVLAGSLSLSMGAAAMFGAVAFTVMGTKTSEHMVGKVMSLALALMSLGVAVGSYVYGFLFGQFEQSPASVLFIVGVVYLIVALFAKIGKQA